MSVTTNILERTFGMRCGGSSGTCFTIDVDGRRYIVTARHIVNGVVDRSVVEIWAGGGWQELPVRLIGHGKGKVDVSVLASDLSFGASHPLSITVGGLLLAEDVYFLGFPFGMGVEVDDFIPGFRLPLIKKGVVSAFFAEDGLMLLDGHNNPGFSGGPVCRRGTKEEQVVIGVVSGYRFDRSAVLDRAGNAGPYTYDVNTGIVHVFDARQILQIISRGTEDVVQT